MLILIFLFFVIWTCISPYQIKINLIDILVCSISIDKCQIYVIYKYNNHLISSHAWAINQENRSHFVMIVILNRNYIQTDSRYTYIYNYVGLERFKLLWTQLKIIYSSKVVSLLYLDTPSKITYYKLPSYFVDLLICL